MNGIIVIDKPQDFTSFDVVAVVRKTLHEKKIGHSGTLDPMATGVLPILIGKAAKAQSLLPDTDKEYCANFRLGITTDTMDMTGKVLSQSECSLSRDDLEAVLPGFRGDIMQIPPMYSAVSKNGVRLYELARKGIEVEREARPVTISTLELLSFDESSQSGSIRISCSKGTYIRVICDDIGKKLGCGCVMTALRRTKACGYELSDSITLEKLKQLAEEGKEESVIRPTDSIFGCFPRVTASEKQTFRFLNGGGLMLSRLKELKNIKDGAVYRVYGTVNGTPETFIGLGITDLEKQELSVRKRFI